MCLAAWAVAHEVLFRVALVAFEPVAVSPHRVEATARAHTARAVLALALTLALAEPDEDGGEFGILKMGKKDAAMALATALAFPLLPDHPAHAARGLEGVAAPAGLSPRIGPE